MRRALRRSPASAVIITEVVALTVKELIEALSNLPQDASVFVLESYDAGCMTTDFDIRMDDGDVLLEKR